MEEKDFNELNDETRARGFKRTSEIKIAEVSTSKKKRAKKATAETPEPAQVQINFDDQENNLRSTPSAPACIEPQKMSPTGRFLSPGLRVTQGLTTFTNLYGIFTPRLRLFTPHYAPLQVTFCKSTTQINNYIHLVLALSRSRSGY
jgi:hypothetical protein